MEQSRANSAFIGLLTIHTALMVAANAAGAKMFHVYGDLAASATVIPYILSLLMINTIGEVFGRKAGRNVIWLGFGAILFSVLFFQLAIFLPAAPFWEFQADLQNILGSTWRIMIAGWFSYLVGQSLDLSIFLKLKNLPFFEERVWLRTWLSSALGQLVDSVIFITIAFAGLFSLFPAIGGQYLVKIIMITVAAPLVPITVKALRAYLRNEASLD